MGRYDGKASGGLCGAKAFESCCGGFGGFKACPKRALEQFRSPIEGLWGGTMAKQAEGCAVLRLLKAAAGVLEVLRPAQNVPCSSFEAQWQSKRRVVRC